LTTGLALATAFGCGLLPLLSNDACFIVGDGTGQLPHFVALLPSLGQIAGNAGVGASKQLFVLKSRVSGDET
jgi:hypothetical protein